MAKKIDPKAKAKRQKIYAAVGGVLLLALLAFQVPRTMKMLHPADESASSTTPPAATTPATSTATPIAAPSLAGGNATVAAAPGGDGLTDPDALPPPQSGQLLAFGLFRTKDPFAQQLKATCTATPDPASGSTTLCSSGSTGGSAGATGQTGTVGATGPSGPSTTPPVKQPAAPQPALTSAMISINGSPESVQVGGQFPAANPLFTLVSLTKKGAKISISGGSLENGAPTVLLTKTKALTLMNTADGTRYVLRLVSVS